jgi:hypothetical protein
LDPELLHIESDDKCTGSMEDAAKGKSQEGMAGLKELYDIHKLR